MADFDETNPADTPRFFFHLGDVIYSFGEAAYYYDQFYEPYRDYPAPIIAIAGNGGHGLARLSRRGSVLRTPSVIKTAKDGRDEVTLENYDDRDYGYLRMIVTSERLRIEYHPASDGPFAKTPDDFVTVVLASRTLV